MLEVSNHCCDVRLCLITMVHLLLHYRAVCCCSAHAVYGSLPSLDVRCGCGMVRDVDHDYLVQLGRVGCRVVFLDFFGVLHGQARKLSTP